MDSKVRMILILAISFLNELSGNLCFLLEVLINKIECILLFLSQFSMQKLSNFGFWSFMCVKLTAIDASVAVNFNRSTFVTKLFIAAALHNIASKSELDHSGTPGAFLKSLFFCEFHSKHFFSLFFLYNFRLFTTLPNMDIGVAQQTDILFTTRAFEVFGIFQVIKPELSIRDLIICVAIRVWLDIDKIAIRRGAVFQVHLLHHSPS